MWIGYITEPLNVYAKHPNLETLNFMHIDSSRSVYLTLKPKKAKKPRVNISQSSINCIDQKTGSEISIKRDSSKVPDQKYGDRSQVLLGKLTSKVQSKLSKGSAHGALPHPHFVLHQISTCRITDHKAPMSLRPPVHRCIDQSARWAHPTTRLKCPPIFTTGPETVTSRWTKTDAIGYQRQRMVRAKTSHDVGISISTEVSASSLVGAVSGVVSDQILTYLRISNV